MRTAKETSDDLVKEKDRFKLPHSSLSRSKWLGNMFWLYALQGLNYLVPLAVLPYLIRVLGVERYGLVAFAQAFAQYFVLITDYGFNLSATKRIAQDRASRESVSVLFWSVMFIKCLLFTVGAAILTILLFAVPRIHAHPEVYVISYFIVLGSVLFPVWLFQGMEQMRFISVVTGGAKVLSAVLLVIFVHQSSDYLLAAGILAGGMLLAGVVGFCIALAHFKIALHLPTRAACWQTLFDGWHLFVSAGGASLYANTGVFLVGLVAGNLQAGYFSVAEKTVRGIQGLLAPITQAVYPHVSALAAKSRELALDFIAKSLAWIGVLSLVPSVFLLLFARPITLFLFGNGAEGSVVPVRWAAMLPFVIAISSVLGVQTMIPFGLEKQLSRIYVAAGLSSLVPLVVAIHYWGATGAAAAILTVEVVVCFAMCIVLSGCGVHLRVGVRQQRISSIETGTQISRIYGHESSSD
jgi:PST family polysaccharide transporter